MDPDLLRQFQKMMKTGTVDHSVVEMYTNKAYLIECQEKALKETNNNGPEGQIRVNSSISLNLPEKSSKIQLTSKNLVGISHLINNTNSKLEGKLFLCRNITPPYQTTVVQIVVDDPDGGRGVRIALFNFLCSKKISEILPIGKILGIKHPWFKQTLDGGFMIRVDHPEDVVYFTDELLEKVFPKLQWTDDIPPQYRNLDNSLKISKTADEWKTFGNINFVAKDFKEAVKCYTEGLKISPENVDMLANRSAANIHLGYFHRALEDAGKTLEISPNHLKAMYRKGKSLWGLKRYKEALDYFEGTIATLKETDHSKELRKLFEKYKRLYLERETGNYNWVKLFLTKDIHCEEDMAEFIGPVAISDIIDKGRGLIATENIQEGQLILISKAFALCHPEKDAKAVEMSLNVKSKLVNFPGHAKLVKKITEKLMAEPELAKEIYQLYPGPQISFPPNLDTSTSIDIRRIDGICSLNGFGNQIDRGLSDSKGQGNISTGLWVLPSYINHSCWDCNSFWIIYGDFMVIRSFKSICQGEEVLMSYIMPTEPYEKRMNFIEKHGFICTCQLCHVDQTEDKTVHEERGKILNQIEKIAQSDDIDYLYSFVIKLEELRALNSNLNVAILHPAQKVAFQYLKQSHFRKAAELMQKAYEVVKNSPLVYISAMYSINIVAAVIYANDEKRARKWIPILQRDLMIAYGSLEIMKFIGKDTLKEIQRCGIKFF